MPELIREHSVRVRSPEGLRFIPRIYGERRADGTWIGWIEFVSINDSDSTLRTGRETSQPNRRALEYWSTGLQPVYLQGAFTRAHLIRSRSGREANHGPAST